MLNVHKNIAGKYLAFEKEFAYTGCFGKIQKEKEVVGKKGPKKRKKKEEKTFQPKPFDRHSFGQVKIWVKASAFQDDSNSMMIKEKVRPLSSYRTHMCRSFWSTLCRVLQYALRKVNVDNYNVASIDRCI